MRSNGSSQVHVFITMDEKNDLQFNLQKAFNQEV
jgi:hypothetical protein